MLISWVGADDDATQSDPDFNNQSDEGSELSFEEDARSSTDGSVRPRRPTIERSERVVEVEAPAFASDPAPEALPTPEALDSRIASLGLGFPKKSKKKSKVSAARAAFEED